MVALFDDDVELLTGSIVGAEVALFDVVVTLSTVVKLFAAMLAMFVGVVALPAVAVALVSGSGVGAEVTLFAAVALLSSDVALEGAEVAGSLGKKVCRKVGKDVGAWDVLLAGGLVGSDVALMGDDVGSAIRVPQIETEQRI